MSHNLLAHTPPPSLDTERPLFCVVVIWVLLAAGGAGWPGMLSSGQDGECVVLFSTGTHTGFPTFTPQANSFFQNHTWFFYVSVVLA
jgi:hypothetical protein